MMVLNTDLSKMKQIIMFHAVTPILRPPHIHSRGQTFLMLPGENVVVCIKVMKDPALFDPAQPHNSTTRKTQQLCYYVKNTLKVGIKFRNVTLNKLLTSHGISHSCIVLSTDSVQALQARWLKGFRTWYTLRVMYVMSNAIHKKYILV
jgi:hypothetical protein